MYARKVVLHNWMRFRGRHELVLEPKIYGVTCYWTHNKRRSNYGGKTAFLEGMFKFALFGQHRKRTEDQWITTGEKEGGVDIVLVGTNVIINISRTRKLGTSTKLRVEVESVGLNNKVVLLDAEAQTFIERTIGFGYGDFTNSSYFGQKQMSRFVTDDPGDRMDIVTKWFRLEPLSEVLGSVTGQLAEVLEEVNGIEKGQHAALDALATMMNSFGMEKLPNGVEQTDSATTLEKIRTQLATVKDVWQQSSKNVALFREEHSKLSISKQLFEQAAEYNLIVAKGKALKKKVEDYYPTMPTEEFLASQKAHLSVAVEELGASNKEVMSKRELAHGNFDGVCPVAGVDCPIKKEINSATTKNTQLLAAATTEHNALAARRHRLHSEVEAGEKQRRQYDKDVEERTRLLARLDELKPAFDAVVELRETDYDTHLREAAENLEKTEKLRDDLALRKANLEQSEKLLVHYVEVSWKTSEKLKVLRDKASFLKEGRRIVVDSIRDISKQNLAAIESGANYALKACNIDLSISVSWERKTKQLAKTCEECGAAFSASRKVKNCEVCLAERGPHMERKLEIIPSNDSGGADDLGGIALQLSAADWLRKDRDAAWAVAILDEPFGSLDAQHASDLATHLPALLKHFGFVQAFIVAHSAGIMAGMPSVVEIQAGPQGSSLVGGLNGVDGEVASRNDRGARPDATQLRTGAGKRPKGATRSTDRRSTRVEAPARKSRDDAPQAARNGSRAGGNKPGKSGAAAKVRSGAARSRSARPASKR